jgi:rhodanese-related sulfurtransferase
VLGAIAGALALMLALGLTGCMGGDSSDRNAPPARVTQTTPAEIAPRVETGEVLLVDVREDEEWVAGRARDAMHVPLATVGAQLEQIRRTAAGRPVAFICRSGRRSAEAAQVAVEAGMTEVLNVDGGMGAWVGAGLPIQPRKGRVL